MITARELLERVLRAQRIDAVYGSPLPGLAVVGVEDPGVARLLADAHRRVHGVAAAVHVGDGRLELGDADPVAMTYTIATAADLLDAAAALGTAPATGVVLQLGLDLTAPAPDVVPPGPAASEHWSEPESDQVRRLEVAVSPVLLAGPGVVSAGAVAGLSAFATAGDLGVLNTWGAKGVLDWRSRHHWATVGLQAADFDLGGLGSADLIVATGVDPDEAPEDRWQLAPVLDLAPGALAPMAERWRRNRTQLVTPPLRDRLGRVTQDGWATGTTPLAPSRVTRHYAQCFGAGGLVAADPGRAGYWVARTFGTTEPGTVLVPARAGTAGLAPACALVARLRRPGRPTLAAVDGPVSTAVDAVLEAAARLGIDIPLEVWDPSGPALGADAHLQRLGTLAAGHRPAPAPLATDPTQLGRMIDVAGPVIAWGGLVN